MHHRAYGSRTRVCPVYFGYPQAHEDDAERATRCGLALVDRVPQLNWAEELHARVGIATGLVVVDAALYFGAVAVRTAGYVTRMPGGVGVAPCKRMEFSRL